MGQTPGEIRYDIAQTRTRMGATIEAIGYRLDLPARMRYRFSHIVHDVGDVFTGKPNGGNGHEGLIAMGEERVTSMLQAAQGGVAGVTGAVEDRLTSIGQTVQTGISDIKENVMDTMTGSTSMGYGTTYGTGQGTSAADMAEQVTQQVKDTAAGTWRRVGWFARDNALALSLGALAVGVIAGMFIPRTRIEQEKIAPLAGEVRQKAVETGEKVLQKGQQMAQQTMGGQSGMSGEPVHAGQTSGQRYGMGSDLYREGE